MNAAETIAAAIQKLEDLRDDSTSGPWVDEYSGPTGNCVIPADAESTVEALAITPLLAGGIDAQLIVTLHRTIDAQLGILGFALEKAHAFPTTYPVGATELSHIALAHAILGEVLS